MSTRNQGAVGLFQSTKSARLGQGPSQRFEGVAKVWVAWPASPPGEVSSAKYRPRSQARRLAQYLAVSVKVRSGLSHYRNEADLGRQEAGVRLGKELGDSPRSGLGYSRVPKTASGGTVELLENDSQKHMVRFVSLRSTEVMSVRRRAKNRGWVPVIYAFCSQSPTYVADP